MTLPGRLLVVDLQHVFGDPAGPRPAGVATDCCVLSTVLADDDRQRAPHLMGLHAPLVRLTATAEVLGGE